jgi:tetratricopeptide (TPR) repeat protein
MILHALFLVLLVGPPQEDAVAKLLREGDGFYLKRDQEGMAAKATECFKKAIAIDEKRVGAYWKIARVDFWLGTHEKDTEKQQAILRDGIEFAKLALAIDSNCKDAHFWLAILYGVYGQARGILQSLHMIDPMKAELKWVLEHDESFEDAGAHRVMGRLYFKLPGIKGGDIEKAKEHLNRAITLAPQNLLNYLYLAEIHEYEGRKADAKACLNKLLEQPDDPRWLPECKEWREEAKSKLKELAE